MGRARASTSKTIKIVCALLLLVVGATSVVVPVKVEQNKFSGESGSVGVVVDAGGSGTRLIVYVYKGQDQLSQLKYIRCEKEGLHKYSESRFPLLRKLLMNCFDQGAKSLPTGKKVPIYFAATAGMRLLKLRNPVMYGKIWLLVKGCIRSSEFKLLSSRTITGLEEAKWGWVAANYLKRTLNTSYTFGTIDFGSSSVQLTFQYDNKEGKSEGVQTLLIDGHNKTIYGHSYLCYGVMEMLRRFTAKGVKDSGYKAKVKNPCYPRGYTKELTSSYLWASPCSSGEYSRKVLGEEIKGPAGRTYVVEGTGKFSQCYADLKKLLDRDCTKTSCGMNNVFQPSINNEDTSFLAFSTFYYIAKGLKILPSSNQDKYRDATRKACAKRYDGKTAGRYDHLRCFQASYGYFMLQRFGFPVDWKLEFIKEINGRNVGWPLGLMYVNKGEMFDRFL